METQATQLGITILSLLVILNVIAAIIIIWRSTRRNPPLDRELYKKYATKDDLKECRKEHAARCLEHHKAQDKIDSEQYKLIREQQKAQEKVNQDIMRSLGRIEGKIDAVTGGQ